MANEKNLKKGIENLDPCRDSETAKARGKQGGINSGIAKRERKLMSAIYAEFLEKEHDIIGRDGVKEKIEGSKLLNRVMSKVLSRGDSASVSMMKEIREGTEGSKVHVTSEGIKKLVDYATGDNVDNAVKQYEEDQEIEEQENNDSSDK